MVDLDIDKTCRVCLKTNLELSLLFDEQNAVDGVNLSDMISECTMYTVHRYDEFPDLICYNCIDRVRTAYSFKKQFEASHRTLINFLESINKVVVDTKPSLGNDKCVQTEESTLYPCEKCDEKFLNYERLREHRLVSHRGTANLCRICLKTFNRLIDLKSHIAVCHPEFGHITPNECRICSKKFTRKGHVDRHMKTVHKVYPDEKTSEMKADKNEITTLAETEIEYERFTNQEADTELISNHDPGDCEDIESSNAEEFVATNPFSSDEDEKPLSNLRCFRKTDNKNSKDIAIKIEANDDSSVILPDDILKSDEANPLKKKKKTSRSFQKLKNRRYNCSECDKSFSRSSHVKRHLLLHREEKPFPCTVCERRFGRADHLKIHLTKHDEEKPFPCDSCDRSYGRSDLLKRHKEHKHGGDLSNRSAVCDLCKKSFSSKNYLRKHLRQHTLKDWKCKWCLFVGESKEALKEHAKSHNKEKPYLCSECGLRFIRKDYLLIHMRRHNGEKPYKCKYCDKGFPRATDLNVHERYHTGEKTHLCTTCGKGFQRAYNLIVHMRVHTGERPYQCQHCPKNFAQCNDLKAHVRRHTGERFKCEICGIGFIQGYNLRQHKFAVHGIEIESRIQRVVKVTSNGLIQKVIPDVLSGTN